MKRAEGQTQDAKLFASIVYYSKNVKKQKLKALRINRTKETADR